MVVLHHNKIRDGELIHLVASKTFIPSAVCDGPSISLGRPTATMPDLDPADPSVTHNFFPRKGGEE
jgi:hypothetical protein